MPATLSVDAIPVPRKWNSLRWRSRNEFGLWWTVRVTRLGSENDPSSPPTYLGSESGTLLYDRPGVAERYEAHRHGGVSSPNFVMEEPALLAELGDVAGRDVLDLGCGDAALGAMLLQRGCASYPQVGTDLEISRVMLGRMGAVLQRLPVGSRADHRPKPRLAEIGVHVSPSRDDRSADLLDKSADDAVATGSVAHRLRHGRHQ